MLYSPYVNPEAIPRKRAVDVSEAPESVIPDTSIQPANAVISAAIFIGVILSLKSTADIIVTKILNLIINLTKTDF